MQIKQQLLNHKLAARTVMPKQHNLERKCLLSKEIKDFSVQESKYEGNILSCFGALWLYAVLMLFLHYFYGFVMMALYM